MLAGEAARPYNTRVVAISARNPSAGAAAGVVVISVGSFVRSLVWSDAEMNCTELQFPLWVREPPCEEPEIIKPNAVKFALSQFFEGAEIIF